MISLIERGYVPHYRSGAACPSCDRGQWHVGRVSAECAFCGTALPLSPSQPDVEGRFQAIGTRAQ